MATLTFDQIVKANQSIERYHIGIEYSNGVIYEGELDFAENRQYILIGLSNEKFPIAEIFWIGEKGYGHRPESESWLSISSPLPNYLQLALKQLQEGNIVSAREEDNFLVVDVVTDNLPPRDNPDEFYRNIFREPADTGEKEFLDHLVELSRSLEVNIQMRINHENLLIYNLTVQGRVQEMYSEMTAAISPSEKEIPSLPGEASQLATPHSEIPMEALLFDLPKIAGWVSANHGSWAQRAIQLIEESEANLPVQSRKYAEIHDPIWSKQAFSEQFAKTDVVDHQKHHPIILGSVYEDCTGWDSPSGVTKGMPDFYDSWFMSDDNYKKDPNYYYSQKAYWRDYHHFGGEGTGLEYAWYFELRGCPKTTKPGDHYYSARDWGYGDGHVDPKHNRLTFTEAIRQYNRYTFDGKRCAYLMLGHVVHLLQDVGQPDHAKLVAHPGSSFTELEAYKKYHYCEIIAVAAVALCFKACPICIIACPAISGPVFGICRDSLSDKKVGYERLIRPDMNKWSLTRIKNQIEPSSIVTQTNYDAFFSNLSKFAKSKAIITSPLGCGKVEFPLVPSFIAIPGCRPFIHLNDKNQVQKFLDFTDKLIPRLIGESAGLIQHFFEIVNYPPIVEKVVIVQWEPGDSPQEFAFFAKDKKHCLRYNAEWVMSTNKRNLKYNNPSKPVPLSPDRTAYVFILFGPTIVPNKGRSMDGISTKLKLVGTDPATGKPINIKVNLTPHHDNKVGHYYWGSFEPRNCSRDPYTLTLVIEGKDNGAHFSQRNPSGDEIDANPSTIAYVDAGNPIYPWKAYEPGPDKNHKVVISRFVESITIHPKSLVISPSRVMTGEVKVRIQQKTWDCQWEEHWGPLNCSVSWGLDKMVTKIEKSPSTRKWSLDVRLWEYFNLEGKLLITSTGEAKLMITVDAQKYTPGNYSVSIHYTIGQLPKKTVAIPVKIT
jgi:hypothetical protein